LHGRASAVEAWTGPIRSPKRCGRAGRRFRRLQFELSLPPDASPNYQSENGELYWELDVKSDEFGRDTHERHRIEVGPAQRTAPATGASAGA
jgi:hypothetical protein